MRPPGLTRRAADARTASRAPTCVRVCVCVCVCVRWTEALRWAVGLKTLASGEEEEEGTPTSSFTAMRRPWNTRVFAESDLAADS